MGCFNYGGFNITQLLSLPFFVDSDRLSQELIIFRARIKKHWPQKKEKSSCLWAWATQTSFLYIHSALHLIPPASYARIHNYKPLVIQNHQGSFSFFSFKEYFVHFEALNAYRLSFQSHKLLRGILRPKVRILIPQIT